MLWGRNFLTTITALIVAAPALADDSEYSNVSKFSFEIKYEHVDGDSNDVTHKLVGGTLEISGELWASRCGTLPSGKPAKPSLVNITVHRKGVFGGDVCSFSVKPSPRVGEKVSFKTTCSYEFFKSSEYYLVAHSSQNREIERNCTIVATGTLTTSKDSEPED